MSGEKCQQLKSKPTERKTDINKAANSTVRPQATHRFPCFTLYTFWISCFADTSLGKWLL